MGFVPPLLAQSATPAGSRTEASTGKPPPIVYVPWEEIDRLLTDDEPGVLISREEFDRLLAGARGAEGIEGAQPEGMSAEYRGRIEAEMLMLDVVLTVRHLGRDPGTWRLPLKGLAIEAASLDERPVKLARETSGELLVQVPGEGTHQLRLKLSAPLVTRGGEQSALLGLPRLPVARVGLSIPAGKHLSWGDWKLSQIGRAHV